MNLSIYGYDLEIDFTNDSMALLNVNNKIMMKSILDYFLYNIKNENNNDIVIKSDGIRLNEKEILYIQDLHLFSFDSKSIIMKVVQRFKKNILVDDCIKERYDCLYLSLLSDILLELDLLELDYEFGSELDPTFFSKIPTFDFSNNDDLEIKEKIIAIVNLSIGLLGYKIIVIYKVFYLLNQAEITEIDKHAKLKGIKILFIDNIDVNEVVSIKQLCIDDYFSEFLIKGKI